MTLTELETEFAQYVPRHSVLGREWQELQRKKPTAETKEQFLRTFLLKIHAANRKSEWYRTDQAVKEWTDEARHKFGLEQFTREDEAKMWARYLAERLCDMFPEGISVYESIDPLLCQSFYNLQEEFDQLWNMWIESSIPWDGSPPMSVMIQIIALAWTIKGMKA